MTRTDQGIEKSAHRYKAVLRTLCFITHGDDVLLLHGSPTKRIWPGKYNGVGGHIEANEDVYSAAIREIHEETGVDVSDVRMRGVINIDIGQETGIILFVFTAQARGREVRPSPEGTLEWVRRDRLAALDLVEDLTRLLPYVLSMRPADPLFFGRYHYDKHEQLVITFVDPPTKSEAQT